MRSVVFAMTTMAVATAWAGPARAQTVDAAAVADRVQAMTIDGAVRGDDVAIREAVALAERGLAAHPGDPWLLHYHGFALYRLAGRHACDEDEEPECVWNLLERAEAALEASLEAEPVAETYAVLGSVYGLMIGENGSLGASLGHRIDGLQERALRLDPENPRVWLLKGIGDLHTPPEWGGGPDVARRSLERAARAFERDAPEPPAPRWGQPDVHVWLGQIHRMSGDVDAARAEFERALEIAPEHAWVRDVLMPALEKDGG